MSSENWVPRVLVPVEVMLCTPENSQDVIDWLTPLWPEGTLFSPFFGSLMVIIDNEVIINIGPNQYLYIDEDNLFHTASKETFEMLYKKEEPPA